MHPSLHAHLSLFLDNQIYTHFSVLLCHPSRKGSRLFSRHLHVFASMPFLACHWWVPYKSRGCRTQSALNKCSHWEFKDAVTLALSTVDLSNLLWQSTPSVGCGSVVDLFLNMNEAMGSILSTGFYEKKAFVIPSVPSQKHSCLLVL